MASDWKEVQLQDVVSKLGDGLHGTPKYSEDGEYYFINGNNLEDGKIVFKDTTKRVNHEQYLKYKKILNDRTLLVSINGTIGNIAYYNEEKVVLGKSACYFNLKDDVDKGYVRYVLSGHYFQSYINAFATGTTIKNVSLKSMREFSFELPPLTEQKAIAHILGSLDDKIELNCQMNETLEAMAQALFKSWFVDFDPVIDNALAAGNAIPDEFIERAELRKSIEKKDNLDIQSLFPDAFEFTEEMGWIPKGWGVSNVGTEFDVTMGQSPPGSTYNELEEGIYFFQGSTDFGFRYPTPRIYCTEPKRLANKRDTLVSVRAPVGDTNLAAVDCCIGRGLAALRHKSGSASFTYYAMLQLKENFKIYEGEGTVFGSINQKDFKNLIQLKLPEILISEFEVNAGALDSKIELNSLNIITLAKLRDTLLPKLMSGELRIPDAAALVDEAI